MSELYLQKSEPLPRTKPHPKSQKIPGQFFYVPSEDGTDENLLILLHGLGTTAVLYPVLKLIDNHGRSGDTHLPFAKLGKSLKLPQTAILSLRAPEQ